MIKNKTLSKTKINKKKLNAGSTLLSQIKTQRDIIIDTGNEIINLINQGRVQLLNASFSKINSQQLLIEIDNKIHIIKQANNILGNILSSIMPNDIEKLKVHDALNTLGIHDVNPENWFLKYKKTDIDSIYNLKIKSIDSYHLHESPYYKAHEILIQHINNNQNGGLFNWLSKKSDILLNKSERIEFENILKHIHGYALYFVKLLKLDQSLQHKHLLDYFQSVNNSIKGIENLLHKYI